MSEEIKMMTEEELDEVAGGRSKKKKKAIKSKYKCLECQKGTHIGKADNDSYIYFLDGDKKGEGYCKRGHHWLALEMYDRFDPVGAKAWFVEHK